MDPTLIYNLIWTFWLFILGGFVIWFVGRTIWIAIRYLEDHPDSTPSQVKKHIRGRAIISIALIIILTGIWSQGDAWRPKPVLENPKQPNIEQQQQERLRTDIEEIFTPVPENRDEKIQREKEEQKKLQEDIKERFKQLPDAK